MIGMKWFPAINMCLIKYNMMYSFRSIHDYGGSFLPLMFYICCFFDMLSMCSAPFHQYGRRVDVNRSHSLGKFMVSYVFIKQYPLRWRNSVWGYPMQNQRLFINSYYTLTCCVSMFICHSLQSASPSQKFPHPEPGSQVLWTVTPNRSGNAAFFVREKFAAKTASFIFRSFEEVSWKTVTWMYTTVLLLISSPFTLSIF